MRSNLTWCRTGCASLRSVRGRRANNFPPRALANRGEEINEPHTKIQRAHRVEENVYVMQGRHLKIMFRLVHVYSMIFTHVDVSSVAMVLTQNRLTPHPRSLFDSMTASLMVPRGHTRSLRVIAVQVEKLRVRCPRTARNLPENRRQ